MGWGDPGRLFNNRQAHMPIFVTPLNHAGAFRVEFGKCRRGREGCRAPAGMRNENGVTLCGGFLRDSCASFAKTAASGTTGLPCSAERTASPSLAAVGTARARATARHRLKLK